MPASVVPGLVLTAAIALLAGFASRLPFPPFTVGPERGHPVDEMLLAVLIGIALRNLVGLPAWFGLGVKQAVQKVLPLAIVLLGAKLDFFDVLRISGESLAISLVCVVVALVLTVWLCLRMGVSRNLGLLIGVGTAICGGTAIVVAAPVVEADENDTAFAIMTITIFGLLSIPLFPALGHLLALSQLDFGIWAGAAIHATPQVVAAGFAYGTEAGDTAVIVKLVRVLLLAPLIVALGLWHAREKRLRDEAHVAERASLTTLFPPFILGFLLMALASTLHLLPDFTVHLRESFLWEAGSHELGIRDLVMSASGFGIAMAMAGVGLGVHLRGLAAVGLRALWVGLFSAIVLAGFSLLLIRLF